MFRKVLIANRGAIACRIIRTLDRMGIASVAVYSEADRRDACHAPEAVAIGPSPAAESYLKPMPSRCGAQTGAEAIHPGYGFLSENPGFAEAWKRPDRLYRASAFACGPSAEAPSA
jgi:urea carboxylase